MAETKEGQTAVELDRRIPITSLVSWVIALVAAVAGGAVFMYRVDTLATELTTIKSQVETQRSQSNSFDGRLIRLETRMDTIIDQNSSILAELRR